jgi:hypothetical protein
MKISIASQSLSLASLFALAACGGDSGSPSAAPPPPSALSVSGTAASGAAIAAGTVEVKCATGTGSVSTGADGTYHVDITGGALPCALRVTSGTTVLHSIVAAGGTTAVANLTPLTELLSANVAGAMPDTLFTSFDTAAQGRVTSTAAAQALSTVLAGLQGTVDLTGIDPIGGALLAAHGTAAGDAHDKLLDQLAAALVTSHVTLGALSAALANATPDTPPVLHALAPAATSCAALRSGAYLNFSAADTIHDPDFASYHLSIDAATLAVSDIEPGHAPSSFKLTAVADHPCSFSFDGDFGQSTVLVSPGGVMVVLQPSSTGPLQTSLALPAQTLALSKLAGTWNYLSYQRDPAAGRLVLLPSNGTVALDSAGKFTSGADCTVSPCTALTADDLPADLIVNPSGGFTTADSDGGVSRVFPVVADNGEITLYALLNNEVGWTILTQQTPLALPAVGDVSTFWDFLVGSGSFTWAPPANTGEGGATTLADYVETVTSVDPTAQSYTRIRTSDQRVDGFTINSPREGLRLRPAGGNYPAAVAMPIQGTGLVFYTSVTPGQNFFGISVNHP